MVKAQVTKLHFTCHQVLVECPLIPPELANNIENPNYWQTLVSELMKQIPLAPSKILPIDEKLSYRIARCNPKIYDAKYDLVELEEWIRRMEKIFIVAEVSDEKMLNIRTLYLTMEIDICWNTVKDKLLGHGFT